MAAQARSTRDKIWQVFGSVRTGIILLIVVGLAVMAGTLILQRPITEPSKLHQVYSPETLRLLDALRLTDVFHSWWFVLLLSLLSANIVVASIERFPAAWRYFSHPARRAEPHFFASLAMKRAIPLRSSRVDMEKVELAFRRAGWKPQYVSDDHGSVSLYAERFRIARMAPFVVHASLLLILAGGIIDGLFGYKGFISLGQNESTSQLELPDGTHKALPFAIRCDGAGQENYPDGTPKRWWSRLAVLENGREMQRKEIVVNDPLTYRGLRFYQASYGATGEVAGVKLLVTPKNGGPKQEFWLKLDEAVPLDKDATVRITQFVPDFVVVENHIESRSDQPNNPAVQISVQSKQAGETRIWLFPRFPEFTHANNTGFDFRVGDVQMGYFTGLQVSHEPGQWAVWAGVILMGVALALVFYFVHVRLWALPVDDGMGRLTLWLGASASKNREDFERRFRALVDAVEHELKAQDSAAKLQRAELAVVK
ncbi:MAG TPA: cytochrome c biogenesis protein ResB [Terriglobales bacterium]|jgi:cytochrome c biogenesis protein|nr:cytochrome c biogenesis protein ResB [Terriglobales bacterium]